MVENKFPDLGNKYWPKTNPDVCVLRYVYVCVWLPNLVFRDLESQWHFPSASELSLLLIGREHSGGDGTNSAASQTETDIFGGTAAWESKNIFLQILLFHRSG